MTEKITPPSEDGKLLLKILEDTEWTQRVVTCAVACWSGMREHHDGDIEDRAAAADAMYWLLSEHMEESEES